MSPLERFGRALERLAIATNLIRTKSEDAIRYEIHGGSVEDYFARTKDAALRFEKAAERLWAQV